MSDGRGRQAERPGDIPKQGWKDIGRRVVAEMKEDHVPVVAAGVAFYAWVALIPTIIAMIMIYGLVASPQTVTQQIEQLTATLSQDATSVIMGPIKSATQSNGLTLGLLASLAAVLWSASGGMDGLIKGINIAFDEEPYSFFKRRGLAILLTFAAIIFVVLAVGLVAVVPVLLGNLGLSSVVRVVVNIGRWVLVGLVFAGGLAALYKVAPNRDDARLRWLSPGAVVATVLWLLGSAAFSFYVSNFGSYNKTYGALAGVIILNLWLFLTSFCVLLGAELNSEMEAQTERDTTVGRSEPMGRRGAKKADELGSTS